MHAPLGRLCTSPVPEPAVPPLHRYLPLGASASVRRCADLVWTDTNSQFVHAGRRGVQHLLRPGVRDRGPGVPAPDVRGVHAVAVLPRQAQSGHAEPAAAHLPLLPRRHLPASGGHQAKAGDDDDEEEEGEGRLESPRHRRSHRSVNLGSSSSSLMGSIASSIGIKIIDDRRIGRADAAAREGQGQQ